ncbi:hypothetical protein [Wolbachia endosymbiont (group A) of Scambus nigricans]|nr:hypothetical protein [Wolbachia endosymbiont (group A) of Scambus nigricans]
MLLACYSHKHISYRIRTITRKAILSDSLSNLHFFYINLLLFFWFDTLF